MTTATTKLELAQDLLRQFGVVKFRATGGSMLPAIAPGDVLTFHACTPEQLVPGQVVLVRQAEGFVVHRLLRCTADGQLITRGDALAAPDPASPCAQLLGVLTQQERGPRTLHTGGRHWLRRQRLARRLIRSHPLAHRLAASFPALTALTA